MTPSLAAMQLHETGLSLRLQNPEPGKFTQHRSFVPYVAFTVDVIVDERITEPDLHRAIDCGCCANSERVERQIQGAAVMDMTVSLHFGISFENGGVMQSNSYDYDVVLSDNYQTAPTHVMPQHFSVHSTGVGETGAQPVAPTIANGLFAATGNRRGPLPMGVQAL